MKQLLLSFLLITTSCNTFRLVPSADPLMLAQVQNGGAMTDSLYNKIIASEDKQFNTYEVMYDFIEADINSILIKNQQRDKAKNLVGITTNLHDAFAKDEDYHRTHNTLTNGEAASFRAQLAAHWQALITAETSLK